MKKHIFIKECPKNRKNRPENRNKVKRMNIDNKGFHDEFFEHWMRNREKYVK